MHIPNMELVKYSSSRQQDPWGLSGTLPTVRNYPQCQNPGALPPSQKYKVMKLFAAINLYPSADLWIQLLSICNGYVQCRDVQSIVGSSPFDVSLTSMVLITFLRLLDDQSSRKWKRSIIFVNSSRMPSTFRVNLRVGDHTCRGSSRVAPRWWRWIPLSTRACGCTGTREPSDRCWQIDYLGGLRMPMSRAGRAGVNQSAPLSIQTPGASPLNPKSGNLQAAAVKQLIVISHVPRLHEHKVTVTGFFYILALRGESPGRVLECFSLLKWQFN